MISILFLGAPWLAGHCKFTSVMFPLLHFVQGFPVQPRLTAKMCWVLSGSNWLEWVLLMGFGLGSRTMREHHRKSPTFASSSTDADSKSQTTSTKHVYTKGNYQRETWTNHQPKRSVCWPRPPQELNLPIRLLARIFVPTYQAYPNISK